MKTVLSLITIILAVVLFSGCYTELATVEQADHNDRYTSDTTYEDGNLTINNHYYLDDEYRRSRLRVSFNYYYPTYSSWISSYYHSYFDDYYWGMYHRPSWYPYSYYSYYYSPYYNPWCYYPSPYYDPWYPYYPPVAYYPTPTYTNLPTTPSRPRPNGPTRDPGGDDRTRPIPASPTPNNPPVAGNDTEIDTRGTGNRPGESLPVNVPDRKRDNEVPWWDRLNTDRPVKISEEARPVVTEKPKRNDPSRDGQPISNPSKNDEERPIERPRPNRPVYVPPSNDRPNGEEAKPVERPKRDQPIYKPPVKKSEPKEEARPVERQRESRQPSYSPPKQSTPAVSTPPRSSGGGNSSSGVSGRKRD